MRTCMHWTAGLILVPDGPAMFADWSGIERALPRLTADGHVVWDEVPWDIWRTITPAPASAADRAAAARIFTEAARALLGPSARSIAMDEIRACRIVSPADGNVVVVAICVRPVADALTAAIEDYRAWRAATPASSEPIPMAAEACHILNRAYEAALALEDPSDDAGATRYAAITSVCYRLGFEIERLEGDRYDAWARYVRDPLINQVGLAWHEAINPDDTGFGAPHSMDDHPWIEA